MNGTIYLITNKVNGNKYVGQTCNTLDLRFRQHISESKTDKSRPICLAINKYGAENFKIESLGEFPLENLDNEEIKLIEEHKTYTNGYNACLGGKGNKINEYDNDLLIKIFTQSNGNISECARAIKLPISSTRKQLIRLGLHQPTIKQSKQVKLIEHDLYFDSTHKCAEYLVANKLTKTTNIKLIAQCIRRVVAGSRNSYLKLHFE